MKHNQKNKNKKGSIRLCGKGNKNGDTHQSKSWICDHEQGLVYDLNII
jgi:hypothetical protein